MNEDLSCSPSTFPPCLQLATRSGGYVPVGRLDPSRWSSPGPTEGSVRGRLAPGGVGEAAPLAGVTSTFPGRTYSPRARCFKERHPSPGPGGHFTNTRGPRFPLGTSGRGRLGLPRPLPGSSGLPSHCPPSGERTRGWEGGGAGDQVGACLALTWCFYSLPAPSCPQWSHPFQNSSAGNREADWEQELGGLEKTRSNLT